MPALWREEEPDVSNDDTNTIADDLEAQAQAMLAQARRLREAKRAQDIEDPEAGLLTVVQFCAKHKWSKIGGIRYAIFHGATNGFESCVVRFGRKVLLDEAKVMQWIRERGLSRGSLRPPRASAA